MRTLKLQMHISIDGFVRGINNDQGLSHFDDELKNHSIANLAGVDCIILGRKTAVDFIPYWESVTAGDPDYTIARRITEIPKIVFTKTIANSKWGNTTLASGEISEEINRLKKQTGGDIIVYGGAGFVSSLIENGLIDEYHLLVNPSALGNGLSIFKNLKNKLEFTLENCRPFSIGQVLLCYKPKR